MARPEITVTWIGQIFSFQLQLQTFYVYGKLKSFGSLLTES